MTDQHHDSTPAVGNQISADIPDIAENLGWFKDCFQHICNSFSDSVLTSLGFVTTIWVSASAMVGTTTNGASIGINEYATNDNTRVYYAFDTTTEEYVCFDIVMPEGWNKSTIKAKFFWSSATGSSSADTVEWEISGVAVSNSDPLDVAQGTGITVSDALTANNGTDLQVTAATAAITIGGTPALGDMVNFKISRNVAGTDAMAEDAWLFGVLIQIAETFPDASGTNAVVAWS
jgi:hypothetical protein